MIRYALRRILWLIPVVIVVSFIVFSLMELAPGTVLDVAFTEEMTEVARQELIRRYNLDKPMIYRYGLYMFNLIQGDLGVSDHTQQDVWSEYISRLPNTLILSFSAIIIGSAVAIPLGIFAAKRSGKIADNATTVFSLIGMSIPAFWLGLLLILVFSFWLGWLPAAGNRDGIRSLILPAVCSSFTLMAMATRQTRSSMLEVLRSDYLCTARSKGVPERAVIRRHALGNAWIPILTTMGNALSVSLAGSVVVESVFAWPGIGRMAAEAVRTRDVTATTGVIILTSVLYVLVQLIVDLLYAFVDPRIKARYTSAGRGKKRKAPARASAIATTPATVYAAATATVDATTPAAVDAAATATVDVTATTDAAADNAQEDCREHTKMPTSGGVPKAAMPGGRSAMKQHRKRSRLGEVFKSLRRNKGAMAGFVILALILVAFVGSMAISWDSITEMSGRHRFARPSSEFLFGADNFGRNMFLRVIYGTRYTLAIGFGSVLLSAVVGVAAGCVAGFYGGKVEDFIMRVSDILASIPGILLGMVIVTVLGNSLRNLVIAVGIQSIPVYIRMTRASVLSVRGQEFVEAARAIGLSNHRILFLQVLPNGLAPIFVTISASLGLSIIIASSLSYLGFGVPVPAPEWGALIAGAREFARPAPHLMVFPGIFIMLTVLAFNLLGDGLRDALDPKLKR